MAENENTLLAKLDGLRGRFEEVSTLITDPNVIADQPRYVRLTREYKELENLMDARDEYSRLFGELAEAKQLLLEESDPEIKEMAREQASEAEKQIPAIEEKIKLLLVPKDPEDSKNAILEIRSGTGGDEAALFAGDLFRMYSKFCESKGWNLQVSSVSEGTAGGFKEIICSVTGADVYGTLKYESGVHRVQRIPVTESQGRIQTSAAGVIVFPEADEDDDEIEIDPKDLKIDIFMSSGPGGQSVNTTYSAVRMTHIPTGITVNMQDEKSQIQNRAAALRVLKSRLLAMKHEQEAAEAADMRHSQVRSLDRSERIRTYNFPENRIVDHRTNYKAYNLDAVLDGDLQAVIDSDIQADEADRLANQK